VLAGRVTNSSSAHAATTRRSRLKIVDVHHDGLALPEREEDAILEHRHLDQGRRVGRHDRTGIEKLVARRVRPVLFELDVDVVAAVGVLDDARLRLRRMLGDGSISKGNRLTLFI
jgi:hypothetical protein